MSSTCTPDYIDTTELDYQPFPEEGRLAHDTNLSLEELKYRVGSAKEYVYCYVVATIEQRDGEFYQTGNGPNFQGTLITLCTCKHFMRTFLDGKSWKGKWIAGFTGQKAGEGKNYLVYLMKVRHAFDSHFSLWYSELIPGQTKNTKATKSNKFGDVYQPKGSLIDDRFSHRNYFLPVESHSHFRDGDWHKDISYLGIKGRQATLLVGDIEYSFLWSKPLIALDAKLHRGQKKYEVRTLFEKLR